jgi:hypothetical protein
MLLFDLCIRLCGPLSEDSAAHTYLATTQAHRTLKILTHTHAQLQTLLIQTEFLGHQIPLLLERDKVLVLSLSGGGLAAGDGTNSHEAEQTQAGARLNDLTAQSNGLITGRAARLGLLAGCVDLNVNADFGSIRLRGEKVGAGGVKELGLFRGIYA